MNDVDKLADELRPICKAMQEDGVDLSRLFKIIKDLDTQPMSVVLRQWREGKYDRRTMARRT